MEVKKVLQKLQTFAKPENVAGMAKYGMSDQRRLGISIPVLRKMAKEIGKNHLLALKLWRSGIPEAQILASMIDEPEKVSPAQMEKWVKDFNSWDVCDQVCGNLFDKTPWAYQKAITWSKRKKEFIKRAGFALMAWLAVHDKKASNLKLAQFFPLIKKEADDERNYVKKAVNWALRQIGKRNLTLNRQAVKVAKVLSQNNSPTTRWIGKDALKELTSNQVLKRLKKRKEVK